MLLCPKCKQNPRYTPPNQRCVGYCKKCWSDRANEWRAKNKDRVRNNNLINKFGITLEDYNQRLAAQGGVCAICKETEVAKDRRSLAVDHCHTTGKVRGLLCGNCNRGIGNLRDSPAILYRAIEYLNAFRQE